MTTVIKKLRIDMRRQIQINSNVKNPTALAQFLTVVSSISAITQKIQYKKFTLKAGGYSNPDIVIYTLLDNMETNFDPVLCRPFFVSSSQILPNSSQWQPWALFHSYNCE